MSVIYAITPELRDKFKEPFGLLIKGSLDQTMTKMREMQAQKPPKIIAVGDIVTKNLHDHKIPLDLSIIDNQNMRKKVQVTTYALNTIKVKNPKGTITKEAIETIKETLKEKNPIHIVVDGEEDLLVLIAVLYAPENSVVVYGQPHEGIVLVKVSPEKKTEASKFLKAMEKGSKS
ncbi:MAG: GTP-dependent dephospho-CoA kinase family protein [Candidatus Bathyarchaeota archaeon]|uniref:GTP-dependent dephospho-CoA kinase family protein n=1 Tax=Candidatus Bathycorpusculum sp. TaxID=2994959 RepID=UPI002822B416|nr:GTP-dependent dephospho-CoA kinase family protein [Candidatus Termiticorpusculum sp.]MCL2257781.1 GTP-dependent dephospho-CoA kinase family protein [Candidatus Termiticorpusculum sp.]MCL2292085.1 GTP-dependent dephospho-CoA kinase family protein [Candidatus Termiticorpusculum sp.]